MTRAHWNRLLGLDPAGGIRSVALPPTPSFFFFFLFRREASEGLTKSLS